MTNSEAFKKLHKGFILRGMSEQTEDSYQRALNIFLRYYENCDIATMGEAEIREFLLYQLSIGKSSAVPSTATAAPCGLFSAACLHAY